MDSGFIQIEEQDDGFDIGKTIKSDYKIGPLRGGTSDRQFY